MDYRKTIKDVHRRLYDTLRELRGRYLPPSPKKKSTYWSPRPDK